MRIDRPVEKGDADTPAASIFSEPFQRGVMRKIISLREARGAGLKKYFNGKPCPHGHVDFRWVSTQYCVACSKEKARPTKGVKAHYHPFCALWKAAKESVDRKDFKTRFPGQHSAAHKRGLMRELCSHMPPPKTRGVWSFCKLLKVAGDHSTMVEFMRAHSGGYDYAQKIGAIDIISSRMQRRISDYDAIYIWGFWRAEQLICKFGVTSQRLGSTRIDYVSKRGGLPVHFYILAKSKNAHQWEALVKEIGGAANLGKFSGSTEFRKITNQELTRAYEVLYEHAV